jgi:hypothetical protein
LSYLSKSGANISLTFRYIAKVCFQGDKASDIVKRTPYGAKTVALHFRGHFESIISVSEGVLGTLKSL